MSESEEAKAAGAGEDTSGGAGGWGSGRTSGWWLLADGRVMKDEGPMSDAGRESRQWQGQDESSVVDVETVQPTPTLDTGGEEEDGEQGEEEAEAQVGPEEAVAGG